MEMPAAQTLDREALSGVWRLLRRCRLRIRSARAQQYGIGPGYTKKAAYWCLRFGEGRRWPDDFVQVSLDGMDYAPRADPCPDRLEMIPRLADRSQSKQT